MLKEQWFVVDQKSNETTQDDALQALGFCFFNNVAVAARQYRRLFDRRILILDWVGHHQSSRTSYVSSKCQPVNVYSHTSCNF